MHEIKTEWGGKIKDIQLSLDSPKCLETVFYYFHIDYFLSLPKRLIQGKEKV